MVASLVREIDPERYESEAVLFDFEGSLAHELRSENYDVSLLKRGPGFLDLALVRSLAMKFRGKRATIVHAHGTTAMIYGALAGRIAGVPVIATEHGRNFPDPWHDRLLHEVAASQLARHVAVSKALRDGIVEQDFRKHSIEIVFNGIDPAPFRVTTRERSRQKLGLSNDTFVGVAIARLVPLKNHDLLFDSWKAVQGVLADSVLLIAGSGPETERLRGRASREFGAGAVRLLGEREDIPDLLAAADVNLLSSKREGLSITLIEALAAGVPSIATDVGGNREVVEDGVAGLLVPERASEMSRAILNLACAPARRRAMSSNARRAFDEKFHLQRMTAAYERTYQAVLERGSRHAAAQISAS